MSTAGEEVEEREREVKEAKGEAEGGGKEKEQTKKKSAKVEVARMTAAGTGMGRQVRSTLLERDDPMSPDSGKGRSRSGSGSESSSNVSSSTSTSVNSSVSSSSSTSVSSSSNSGVTKQDKPSKLAKTKCALRNVKSEEVVARAKKPHFYVETSGRPPRVSPTKATRQEKHKRSDARQRSLQILEEFVQKYDSSLGQLLHHYKECCKKKDHPAGGVYALRVIRAISRHVSGRLGVCRACSARFACCLQSCPWCLANVSRVERVLLLTPFFCRAAELGDGGHLDVDRGSTYHLGRAGVRYKELFKCKPGPRVLQAAVPHECSGKGGRLVVAGHGAVHNWL